MERVGDHFMLKHVLGQPQPKSFTFQNFISRWYSIEKITDIEGMAKEDLSSAKKAKNDEFYTQYEDIEKEINAYLEYNPDVFKGKTVLSPCDDPEWSNFTKYFTQNFKKLGLKKFISTSYAPGLKSDGETYQPPLFEIESEFYDEKKSTANGKIFVLTQDENEDGKIDINDLRWEYLEGDGDFRSDEVKKLRNESDFIITNPPFSLFREFVLWINEADKKFSIIGNMNAITYKEVFPLIKDNKIWLGVTNFNTGMYFFVPESFVYSESYKFEKEIDGKKASRVPGVCWFTSIEHGRRHEPMKLMTKDENIKFSKHKEIKGIGYKKYDNYDAIEVPYADSIPSDETLAMGVPISFLHKYNPDQFEIVKFRHGNDGKDLRFPDGTSPYFRILIKHKTKKAKK